MGDYLQVSISVGTTIEVPVSVKSIEYLNTQHKQNLWETFHPRNVYEKGATQLEEELRILLRR